MPRCKLLRNLVGRVDRGIDRSKESVLCILESRGERRKADATDDHQIDVAGRVLFVPSDGAIDKSDGNAVAERLQALDENVSQPRSPQ